MSEIYFGLPKPSQQLAQQPIVNTQLEMSATEELLSLDIAPLSAAKTFGAWLDVVYGVAEETAAQRKVSRILTSGVRWSDNPWKLTPAECLVMDALVSGQVTDKHIARVVYTTPSTVQYHFNHTMRKMGTKHRVTAALMWDRWVREFGATP